MKTTATFLALFLAGTASAGDITIHGSTSMGELNSKLAAQFKQSHPAVTFSIVGSDSAAGIADLLKGTTILAGASRPVKDAEMAKFNDAGKPLNIFPVARDGVAVYVHPGNRVSTLTMAQLAKIFAGTITNWKTVGGDDASIHLYVREASSGTHQFFREKVMENAAYADGAKEILSTSVMLKTVANDRSAIGYASTDPARQAKTVSLKVGTAPAVLPNREAVVAGTYPISRIFYYLSAGTPSGDAMAFIQWVVSAAGQKAVADAGFFQLK